MSASTYSRTPSLLSLDTTLSSCSSFPSSPIFSSDREKASSPASSPREVLHWKPILSSSAFTYHVSTHIHFTAFPPHDLKKPTFGQLSRNAAQALLLEHMGPTTLSFFANKESSIRPVSSIPWPSSLPRSLLESLQTSEWDYFSVTNTRVSLRVGKFSTGFDHHVAIRPIRDGVERYIFGPAGLCVHSVCSLEDAGVRFEEHVPRETLYLQEETEVLCHTMLKRWTRSLLVDQIAASHERFRLDWDMSVRHEWSLMKMRQEVDLLA